MVETKENRDIHKCCGCGYKGSEVECAGIYYCPNKLCSVAGGAVHRHDLVSYKRTDDQKHTVDRIDWVASGLRKMYEQETCGKLKEKTIRSAITLLRAELKGS